MAAGRDWGGIDVVILDAADEGRVGDQFPGVRVVRHIRADPNDARPTIIVVTGHFFDDGLRRRMAEADADLFFLRPEIRSAEKLIDIVLAPEHYRRGVPPVGDQRGEELLGLTSRSKVEEFVAYVEQHHLEGVLGPSEGSVATRGRRSLLRHRKDLARQARITAINHSTGFPPGESQRSPSIRQLRGVWSRVARVKYPRDPLSPDGPEPNDD